MQDPGTRHRGENFGAPDLRVFIEMFQNILHNFKALKHELLQYKLHNPYVVTSTTAPYQLNQGT